MTRGEAEDVVGGRVVVRQEDPFVAAVVVDAGRLLGFDGPEAVVDLDDGRRVHCPVTELRGVDQ
ncbi:hypothetical protein [Kitasatospora sp. NPDC057223]|uniref:hypothetical protein n=1 Tax=Kitasatospora sp. NPDC057223 TaxID=3346055 RepID=UPI0036417566